MMTNDQATLLAQTMKFATESHGDQKRKYTGEPYVTHPIAVMKIVQSVPHSFEMLQAALLHDVVEDTEITIEVIEDRFGPVVAEMVSGLTDVSRPEDGNRETRKAKDRDHTAQQSAEVQTIKLADLIHNTQSIEKYDPGFYQVYKQEKIKLLSVLTQGDRTLMYMAQSQIGGY